MPQHMWLNTWTSRQHPGGYRGRPGFRSFASGCWRSLRAYGEAIERPAMVDEKLQRVLSRDVPDYHERQAAYYRALAEMVTTPAIKAQLLREVEAHERVGVDFMIRATP